MTPPPTKKQKQESTPAAKPLPPRYGSQAYWEDRYQKNRRIELSVQPALNEGDNEEDDDSDALPYHAWYFTYDELRPLILPLILGGDDEVREITNKQGVIVAKQSEAIDEIARPMDQSRDTQVITVQADDEHNDGDDDDDHNSDEGQDESDDDSIPEERAGLAKLGPISVLEIGCGDMPLGKDLALELDELQRSTGLMADNVVKRIVCCDYSPAVVQMLREKQQNHHKEPSGEHCHTTPLGQSSNANTENAFVDYVVGDARDLPYPNDSFHLVLEKGTLDAMLSEKETGISSCKSIVSECARVLTTGGYMMIVSHLNAHTSDGVEWLNEVVIPGLRAGGGNAKWEIEVHGNDGLRDEESESDDESPSGDVRDSNDANSDEETPLPPSGSPGPAVYIIQKLQTGDTADPDFPPPVPLKFFSY